MGFIFRCWFSGNIGEASKLAILIGLAYLVIRGIINLKFQCYMF